MLAEFRSGAPKWSSNSNQRNERPSRRGVGVTKEFNRCVNRES